MATDTKRLKGQLPLRLQRRSITTCYVLINLAKGEALPRAARVLVRLEPEPEARRNDLFWRRLGRSSGRAAAHQRADLLPASAKPSS